MILSWNDYFDSLKDKPYYQELVSFWNRVYSTSTVFPPREKMLDAFKACPLEQTKVILLGQDPYHDDGQAMGLSFSVPSGVALPPSLKNIYKGIESDLGVFMNYKDGDLTYLAHQGVLLLNVNLTVEAHKPLSHQKNEYLDLTKGIMQFLDQIDRPMVFILLGGFAKKFECLLGNPNHLVLVANHPSPLSANRGGFFGTHLFSQCNEYLATHNEKPIQWGNALF